jgi:hypothetical protein
MQLTSSIEPVLVTESIVEAPRPHVRDLPLRPATHEPSTPLWTRHTLGAIEADRDGRDARRVDTTVRYRTAPPAPAIPLRPEVVAR